jgi:hypothetical protein
MSGTEVTELIAALRAGTLTLQEVASRFRDRDWPDRAPPAPRNYLELAAAAQGDPQPDIPGSFDDVIAARDRGELSRDEYRILAGAVAAAINASAVRRSAGR